MASGAVIEIGTKGSIVAWDQTPSSRKGSTEQLLHSAERVELGLRSASSESTRTPETIALQARLELEDRGEQSEYVRLLEEIQRSSAQLPGDFLDKRLQQFTDAFDSASLGSVIFTSQPVRALMTKKYFGVILCVFIAFFVYLGVTWSLFVASLWNCDYAAFGVTGLPRNLSTASGQQLIIHGAGLLKGIRLIPGTQDPVQMNEKLIFPNIEEAADGWYLIVEHSWMDQLDVEQVQLEGYKELGGEPQVFPRSAWELRHPKTVWILHECLQRRDLCGPGAATHMLSNISTSQQILAFTFRSTDFFFLLIATWIVALGIFAQVYFAFVLKWTKYSIYAAGCWCSLLVPTCLVAAFISSDAVSIFLWFGFSISLSMLAVGVTMLEKYWFWVWCCNGVFNLVLGIINFVAQRGGWNLLILGLFQVSTFLLVVLLRERMLRQARSLIKPDLEKYGQVWAQLQASEEMADLAALKVTVAGMRPASLDADLRQRVTTVSNLNCVISEAYSTSAPRPRPVMSVMFSRLPSNASVGIQGTDPGSSSPTNSLSQLYCQAKALERILQHKILRWALESNGYFAVKSGSKEGAHGVLVPAQTAMESIVSAETHVVIKWGGVKKPARAIEKVCRSYNGDCSRLLDVCRQSCVFESVKDLALCLHTIRDDEEVTILRLKNRLDTGYDARQTGGYRDVAINLQIDSELTRRLGIEEHICEVQLILKSFFLVRSDQGHARYVYFRNLRGE